jgi:acyl dehydratase/CBS domain-containing protein
MPFPIRLADVMSSPVRTTSPDTPAAEAAARCHEEGIGSLVVVDGDEVVGIVTSDDFVELLGADPDARARSVESFMSAPVVTSPPETPVGDAVAEMLGADIARLVVVEDGDPVGVVSSDDIVRHVPQVFHRGQFDSPPSEHQYRVTRETAYEEADWESECACVAEDAVSVGDRVTFSKPLTEGDVRAFATASGDTNRLHLDAEYAAGSRFGRRIVHGTLASGVISAALARLPGLTIYLSQDLSFLKPVGIGERVTAVCEVVENFDGNKYQLTTDVLGADGAPVIEGQASVLIDEAPVEEAVAVEALAGSGA